MSMLRQDGYLRFLRMLCITLIAITWLSSGVYKLLDMQDFHNVVYEQGVLPGFVRTALGIVPFVEIALGASLGSSLYGSISCRIWGLSLGATLGFMLYVVLIPSDIIETTGCGCGGVAALVQKGPWDAKMGHLGFLALFALAHGGFMIHPRSGSAVVNTEVE